jgi:hypothetical protein
MDNQLREALGSYAARDYLTQLGHRSEIAGRTLVGSVRGMWHQMFVSSDTTKGRDS